jgi:outer membrane immunogenic protein
LGPSLVGQAEVGGGYGGPSKTQPGIPGTAGIPVAGIPARVPNDSSNVKATWDMHLLGRLGVPVMPGTTVFVTGGGGLLYSKTTVNCTVAGVCGGIGVPPFIATSSATRAGWILGTAVETMLGRGWRARLEYRHADYGSSTATYGNPALLSVTANTKLTTDTVMLGLSYQLGAPLLAPAPRPLPSGPPVVVKAPALK